MVNFKKQNEAKQNIHCFLTKIDTNKFFNVLIILVILSKSEISNLTFQKLCLAAFIALKEIKLH